ncbi:CrcB family protein [Schaalia sp. 19OD2882]|uniref:CrcB family protein n=1 Tax=Schaalia sp. 19OD2882 TaxID=2794089 RepID=UPI001C1EE79A|nr:CrcB family protein [Schaalia sp. 19OD2882]QWW19424.1 CrcB family protein [Schaalia sp. 19OD2882]
MDEDEGAPGRAAAIRSRLLDAGAVALGGAAGTGLRLLVGAMMGTEVSVAGAHVPASLLLVNVLGALGLGMLGGWIASRSAATAPSASGRRMQAQQSAFLRPFLGTGMAGGFTSYSALASAALASSRSGAGAGALALLCGLALLVLGVVAVACGWWFGGILAEGGGRRLRPAGEERRQCR